MTKQQSKLSIEAGRHNLRQGRLHRLRNLADSLLQGPEQRVVHSAISKEIAEEQEKWLRRRELLRQQQKEQQE